MNFSSAVVDKIIGAVELAATLQVDGLIFDDWGVHAYEDDEAIFIVDLNDYGFPFGALGLAGTESLWRKLKVMKNRGDISMSAETKTETIDEKEVELVTKLTINCNRLKYEHRCSDPRRITDIPKKKMNLKPRFSFELNSDDLQMMKTGSNAMSNRNVLVKGEDERLWFTFSDEDGATMEYEIESGISVHGDDDTLKMVIEARKMAKILNLASAQEGSVVVNILRNNIVYIKVNGIDICIMSEV
jgi:hypothetical protein